MQIQWPAGLDTATFLRDYWQKRPLLIRQGFPGFISPLSADELGGLALEADIASRLILRENDQRWHVQHGPFNEAQLTSLPAADWSLLVSDIDRHLDGFQDYLEPFRFIPDWRIDDLMISYAPSGASVGPHRDNYDVFLLQAAGTRLWQFGPESGYSEALLPDLALAILADFAPDQQAVLQPGDILYLPPGIPHHGISQDNDCMTWSIGFRAPSPQSLLGGISTLLQKRLSDTPQFRDQHLRDDAPPGLISQAALEQLHAIWREATTLDDAQFTELAGCVLTQPFGDVLQGFDADELDDNADDHQHNGHNLDLRSALAEYPQLRRHPHSRIAYTMRGNDCWLFANGQQMACCEALANYLCNHLSYASAELAAWHAGETNDQLALEALYRRAFFDMSAEEN